MVALLVLLLVQSLLCRWMMMVMVMVMMPVKATMLTLMTVVELG